MTFRRLNRWDVLAMVAALALLPVMAFDWYTDKVAQQDRQFQRDLIPRVNQEDPTVSQDLNADASKREKNAWQAPGVIDRVLLVALLGAAGLAVANGFKRASGSRGPPPLSAMTTVVGLVASLLLLYRILQPPGPNYTAIVNFAAVGGLICVGLLTLGARLSTLKERERPPAEPAEPEVPAAAP